MKKNLLFALLALCSVNSIFSQAPQSVPYQAVARDASGNLLVNTTVCVQYRIFNASSGGTLLYEEHQSATTNKLGLFNANVGLGTYETGSGSTYNTLGAIPWGSTAAYLEIGLNVSGGCTGSNTYTTMGRSQMMSVPFALYAGSAASSAGPAGGDLTGTYPSPILTTTGVTANTYGSATQVPQVTVDAKGRITSASNITISGTAPGGNAGGDLTGTYPNPTLTTSGVTSGIYGTSSTYPVVTVDAKGRVTNVTTDALPTSLPPNGTAGGDLTGTYPSPTLTTTGVTANTYGSATQVSQVTVDAKGRVTSASNVTISGTAPGGNAGGDLTGTYPNPTLVTSGVTANTYGSATQVPQFTVDAKGRVTSASNVSITPSGIGALTSVLTNSPITGNGTSGNAVTCTTCLTSASGGALSQGTGISISGNTIANSGVTSIVAGTNVTISPLGGTGAVTINSSVPPGSVTADNGVNVNTGNNVELGGYLTKATTVTQAGNTLIYNLTGTGDLEIEENSAPSFYVLGKHSASNDGYVGIGTATPSAQLHIVTPNTTGTSIQLRLAPTGGGGSSTSVPSLIDFYSTFDQLATDQGPRRTASIRSQFSGGAWGNEALLFEVGDNGSANDAANEPIERMRITGAGNVRITNLATPSSTNGGIYPVYATADGTLVAGYPTQYTNGLTRVAFNYGSHTSVVTSPSTWTWVCPSGVSSVYVKMWGAGGGEYGGSGGFVSGIMPVSTGTTYYIIVGQGGYTSSTTVECGGGGTSHNGGGNGGGRSAIRTNLAGADLITAGGGGGGNSCHNDEWGGAGGSTATGSAGSSSAGSTCNCASTTTGGSQSSGGCPPSTCSSGSGATYIGGCGVYNGSVSNASTLAVQIGGNGATGGASGGGRGYYGGGGGNESSGAGGGSNYVGGFSTTFLCLQGNLGSGSTAAAPNNTDTDYSSGATSNASNACGVGGAGNDGGDGYVVIYY